MMHCNQKRERDASEIPNNPDPVVVHLQFAVEFQWFAREEQDVAGRCRIYDGVRLL